MEHLPPVTPGAGRCDDLPFALTAGAGRDLHKRTQDRLLLAADLAGAVALRTAHGRCARVRSGTVTVGARVQSGDLDLLLAAKRCFLEGQCEIVAEVCAPLWRSSGRRAHAAEAKEVLEDVAEAEAARTGAEPSTESCMAPAIVVRPFSAIA